MHPRKRERSPAVRRAIDSRMPERLEFVDKRTFTMRCIHIELHRASGIDSNQSNARALLLQGAWNYNFGSHQNAIDTFSHCNSARADLARAHDECHGAAKKGSRRRRRRGGTGGARGAARSAFLRACSRSALRRARATLCGAGTALCRTRAALRHAGAALCSARAYRDSSYCNAADRPAEYCSPERGASQRGDLGRKTPTDSDARHRHGSA